MYVRVSVVGIGRQCSNTSMSAVPPPPPPHVVPQKCLSLSLLVNVLNESLNIVYRHISPIQVVLVTHSWSGPTCFQV